MEMLPLLYRHRRPTVSYATKEVSHQKSYDHFKIVQTLVNCSETEK